MLPDENDAKVTGKANVTGENNVEKNVAGLGVFFKGIAMGAADVVPGVSGGTIAFITGIYERLLNALKSLHPLTLPLIWQYGFATFWKAIDGRFLLTLFSGVVLSIISLAKVINYLLDAHPILVWSFFFGLVIASALYLIKQVKVWKRQEFAAIFLGAAIALGISVFRPAQLPDTWWMVMFSGFVAICAMILPGISGSFILLLMGMYRVVIDAITELHWLLLGSFLVGCLSGLIVFSHVLSFLLKRYSSMVLALLTGFLIGSLNILWPWKRVVETIVDRHGNIIPLVQENISPLIYSSETGEPAQLVMAIMAAFAGFLIVLVLERSGQSES